MSYVVIDEIAAKSPWRWLEMRRVSRARRTANIHSDRVLLSLSAHHGLKPRPDDGGRQPPTAETVAAYWNVEPNDLVFNPMWAIEGGVAVSDHSGAVSTAYRVYQLQPEVEPRFAHHYFRCSAAIAQYRLLVRGVTTFDRAVTREDFESMPMPLPSLVEQRAIADYLDAETARIDALISKKRRMIEVLEARLDTTIATLLHVDARSVPLRRLFLPTIGGSWGAEAGTLDVDAACIRGTDFDMQTLEAGLTAPIRSFTWSDLRGKQLHSGDLIIEKSGGGEAQPVGRAVSWQGSGLAVPTNFAARLRPVDPGMGRYLCVLLNAAYRAGMTRSWIKQTTGIQNLELGGLLGERVPVPDAGKRARLLSAIDDAMASSRSVQGTLQRQIALLAEHRQALITAAVTGELDIPGAA